MIHFKPFGSSKMKTFIPCLNKIVVYKDDDVSVSVNRVTCPKCLAWVAKR